MRIPAKFGLKKSPVQARSHATVDAILQAATYILAMEGRRNFTTNRIAERAGVNIASLYQYFPNKMAILAQLQKLHSTRIQTLPLRIRSSPDAQRDLDSLLRAIVDAVLKEHQGSPDPHGVFGKHLPRDVHDANRSPTTEQMWEDLVRPFTHGLPDAALTMFIARHAMHGVVHQGVSTRPEVLRNPLFADELVTLLTRYFHRPDTRQ